MNEPRINTGKPQKKSKQQKPTPPKKSPQNRPH